MYTPKQVKKTIERSGLNVTYACFGIAMFSGRAAFDQYHQEIDEACDYDGMRTEIADKHFNGNDDFEITDITSVSFDYGGGLGAGGFNSGGGDGGGSD